MPNAKTKRKRNPNVAYVTYVFEIGNWRPLYCFSLNIDAKHFPGPYWEHASLEISGEFVHPATLKIKAGRIHMMASREQQQKLEHPTQSKTLPLCVGSLSLRHDSLEFLGSLPADAFWGVANALGIGAFRYAVFHGEALKWRSALIRSISFEREIEFDELD